MTLVTCSKIKCVQNTSHISAAIELNASMVSKGSQTRYQNTNKMKDIICQIIWKFNSLLHNNRIPDCRACARDGGAASGSPQHFRTRPWQGIRPPHYRSLLPPADGPPSVSPAARTVCETLVRWGSHPLQCTRDLRIVNINTAWPVS
jgi:hypothetical protein